MAETSLFSPGIMLTETDKSAYAAGPIVAGAALVGPTVKGPVLVPTKITSYAQYANVFGTTFQGKDCNHTTASAIQQEFMTSLAAKSYFEQGGETLLVIRANDASAFNCASAAVTASNSSASFKIHTLGEGAMFNSATGSDENFKWQVSNVNPDAGTFTLVIRRGNDTDDNPVVLETWNNVSLDPYSSNYIAAVIGDQYSKYVSTEVKSYGSYVNNSAYIRVEVENELLSYDATSMSSSLPATGSGTFNGGTGLAGVPYENGSEITGSYGNVAYFGDITSTTKYPQAVSSASYEKAIELLENEEEFEFKVVSAPGVFIKNDATANAAETLCNVARDRGDCIAVVDTVTYTGSLSNATEAAADVDNSYAATYWPWLQTQASTGRAVWIPASVVIPGVYAYNDNQTAPWYAPAGMTRGGISAIQAAKKLTKKDRDDLYVKNVNPIATLPGTGLVIYGQKTLQKKSSALDRVNVRRLMIEVKKKVKDMASSLLFEQNTTTLQNNFKAKLDPYLASIVQRNGLYNYAINLDGNTAEAIDRNEFHCSIILQPAKTIEYVYINFTITATGVEFA